MILVTGGAGFIGRRVTKLLADSRRVRVLDDLSNAAQPEGCEFILGDVTNLEVFNRAAEGAKVIVHLAAASSVTACDADPITAAGVNVTGAVNAIVAARREGAHLVFASSAAVYAETTKPAAEGWPAQPASLYGATKRVGEAAVVAAGGVAARIFNAYHPTEGNGVIARWNRAATAGQPLELRGDGSQARDYVHVDDVAAAIAALATTRRAGVLNVCTGTSTTLNEVLAAIRRRHDGITVTRTPRLLNDVACSVGDPARLRAAAPHLRFRSLEEGLA